jgi:hypothetical protein
MTRASRLLIFAAIAAMAVAACGGSAATVTPSPTATTAATPEPVDTPEPSVAPSESPTASASGDGPDLEGATSALEAIKKYEIALTMSGMMPVAEGATEIQMSGLVDQDNDAYQFELNGFAQLGAGTVRFVVIGNDAWIDLGTGTYISQPGGGVAADQMRDSLSPATLLGQFPTSGYELFRVGEEDRNGIATTHYHASAADTPTLATSIGEDGVMDFWISNEGGYLVSMEMDGEMDVDGSGAKPVTMSIDLSRINDETISIQPPN